MGIEITRDELKRLNNALDYLVEVVRDVTVQANDSNTRIKYLLECNRIHELASEEIEKIRARNAETKRP